MLNTYLEIGQHLFDYLPEINWIDRDKGQIDHEEEFHSLICPAILLDFGEIEWTGLNRGNQRGELTITTKLIFVKPTDTFSRQQGAVLQDYAKYNSLSDQLHRVTSMLQCVGDRRKSADYFTRYWYVIEQQYDLTVEYSNPIRTVRRPNPLIDGAISTNFNIPVK